MTIEDLTKVKQVIVIRKDLKMRRGKEIAQSAHASMSFITKRIAANPNKPVVFSVSEQQWLDNSFRKIGLKVDSLDDLLLLERLAKEAGLEVHLITDDGLTEFNNVPTITALAIGPDYDELIDVVTKAVASVGLY